MSNLPLTLLFFLSVLLNVGLVVHGSRRRQASGALATNFRRMLESAPDAMLIVDQAGIITLANRQCEIFFGYSQAELLGQPVEVLLPTSLHEIHREHRTAYSHNPQARPMGAGSKWQLFALRRDGTRFPVEISLSPLRAETGLLTMASIRDITKRKQMEDQMYLQAAALEAAANAIVITTPNHIIEWVNPAFTRLTGYTAVEAVGRTPELLRSGRHSPNFYADIQTTIQAGLVWEGEIINRRKDGLEYVEQQTITPVRDQQGEFRHFVAIKQDITARQQAERALREAETKYRTLVEQMPAVMYIDEADEVGRSQYVSPQVEALLGYPYAEWEADPLFWYKCLYPEDHERAVSLIHITLSRGHATEEYRMIAQDGRVVWLRDHAILIRDADGQPKFVQGFLEDVTERRQAEDRRTILYETLRAVGRYLDSTSIAQSAVEAIAHLSPWTSVGISRPDPDGKTWKTIAGAGKTVGQFGQSRSINQGVIGRVYRTGQTQHVKDISTDPDYFRGTGTRSQSELAVPIKHHESILGVLNIESDEPNDFNDQDISLAKSLADAISLGMANAYQYTETQVELNERKRTEEALRSQNDYLAALHEVTLGLINRLDPDSLLEAELDHLTALMKTRHAVIELIDPAENVLVQKISVGNYVPQNGFRTARGVGITGRVWDSGSMLIIPNYAAWEGRLHEYNWVKTVAGVPLKVGGEVIGVICVAFDEADRIFSPAETDLLQRFADLAAMALDNARLVGAAVRQSKELSLLHEVRTAISRETALTHIVKRTVEAIAETFGYALVGLYLLEQDTLILQHQVGYEQVIPKIPITKGILGRVVRTHHPILVEDVRNDPSFLGAMEGITSEVAVPIFDEGQVVGVLNVESKYGVILTEEDLRLMLALSDQVSVAIGRARLYANLSRTNERLSTLHKVTIDLLNQRSLDELLQSITDHAVIIVNANASYIALAEGETLVDRAISPQDFPYEKVAAGKDNSPPWQVFESHEAFITDDFSSLPTIRSQTQALGVKAAVFLPIMAGENCLGVLGTGRMNAGHPFNEEDITFGNLFASLAGVALDNAQLHEALHQESIRDPLTGLFNRRFMEEALSKELKRAERNARPLAVVMLDLDYFKHINDNFGHDAGDEALRQISALFKSKTRASDIVCRYGGEEFTLILPDAYLADALQRVEQLRKDIKKQTITHQGLALTQLTGSFGIAIYPEHGTTCEDLLKAADAALYRAKQLGRDRVVSA